MNPIYESMETEGKQIISMSVKSVRKGTTATIYLFVYTPTYCLAGLRTLGFSPTPKHLQATAAVSLSSWKSYKATSHWLGITSKYNS